MGIAAKLKIKEDLPLWLINMPGNIDELLEGADYKTTLPKTQTVGQLVLFVVDKAGLEHYFRLIETKLSHDALFWIAYPKKSGSIRSDISRDNGWDIVFNAGFDPVTQVAIDKDWSALRFRPADAIKEKLREIPMAERNTEGIDYVNRTTTLPADALKALKQYKGLNDFFDSMAFSHRKEYILAIADARKPETRQRRIDKMVEALLRLRTEKEMKKKK